MEPNNPSSGERPAPNSTRLETSGCEHCGEPYTTEETYLCDMWVRPEKRCPACRNLAPAPLAIVPVAAAAADLGPVQERFKMKICGRCGMNYNATEREVFPGRWSCWDFQCPTCDDADRIATKAKGRTDSAAARVRRFEALCPGYYRTEGIMASAPEKLRLDLTKRVMEEGMGAMVVGPTGRFKTTSVFNGPVRSLLLAGGEVRYVRATEWREEISAAAKECRVDRALGKYKSADWLFFDDLGQAAGTDSSEEALYELVEVRRACNRPMLVTTQFSGDDFLQRFRQPGGHRAKAIAQRIAELTSAKEGIFTA